jgi:hypothetical protein
MKDERMKGDKKNIRRKEEMDEEGKKEGEKGGREE